MPPIESTVMYGLYGNAGLYPGSPTMPFGGRYGLASRCKTTACPFALAGFTTIGLMSIGSTGATGESYSSWSVVAAAGVGFTIIQPSSTVAVGAVLVCGA